MRSLGLRPSEVRATGGGSKSRLWLQVTADILQTPVMTLREPEAAALGGALQAIWCHLRENGAAASIREVTASRVSLGKGAARPEPKNAGVYQALQERFNSLWRRLEPEFRAHRRAAGSF